MSTANNNATVSTLETIVQEWTETVGQKLSGVIHFDVTDDARLSVNGIALCPISEIDADAANYDVECLYIPTVSGSYYEIYLDAPYEGPWKVGYIHLISSVYSADSQKSA